MGYEFEITRKLHLPLPPTSPQKKYIPTYSPEPICQRAWREERKQPRAFTFLQLQCLKRNRRVGRREKERNKSKATRTKQNSGRSHLASRVFNLIAPFPVYRAHTPNHSSSFSVVFFSSSSILFKNCFI